jgi:transcriptional regulator with XRE-family HTH domain
MSRPVQEDGAMLNKRIHDLRVAQGYSQVAQRLGVSKQAVSNWENDNIQPSIEMLIRLAELFSVSTDYLLGREAALQVDLSGLDEKVVGHLLLLVDDLRRK